MSLTGSGPDDPQRVGVPIGDLLAGMYGAYGVLAALHERSTTGRGQVVRTSLLSAVVGVHAFQGTRWTVAGEVGRAQGNHHPSIAPYGLFRCRDGAVQIAVGSEGLWRRLCDGFGIDPATPGLETNSDRVAARERTIEVVEAAFADWDAEALLARLAEVGVPAGKVRTLDEVYEWEQTRSQGLLVEVDHASLGPVTLPGPPLRFFDAVGWRDHPRATTPPRRCSTSTARPSAPGWRRGVSDPPGPPPLGRRGAARPRARRGVLAVVGPADRHLRPRRGLPARAAGGPGEGRHGRVRDHRSRARPRPAGGGGRQRVPLPGRLDRAGRGRPHHRRRTPRDRRGACRCWPPRRRAAPACRRGRRPSSRWSRSPGPSGPTGPPGCPTSSTCATPRPAASTPRGARSATSPSPSPGRWSGFLGPKVFEALNGQPFPAGVQQAENLAAKGVIDAVVAAEQLPELVDRSLRVLLDAARAAVAAAPRPDRAHHQHGLGVGRRSPGCPAGPGCGTCCGTAPADTLRLRGTDEGERDETVIVALTRLDGQPCVLVGQDRSRQDADRAMGPAALREARRGDEPRRGARPAARHRHRHPRRRALGLAEERAVAGEIARCIATMTRMRVPTLAVLLGQGCGGGALALLPARRVLAAQHAWLSPLPPEGASVIVHGDTAHAEEMATRQQVRALDLAANGTVHRIVPEREDDDRRDARPRGRGRVRRHAREHGGRGLTGHFRRAHGWRAWRFRAARPVLSPSSWAPRPRGRGPSGEGVHPGELGRDLPRAARPAPGRSPSRGPRGARPRRTGRPRRRPRSRRRPCRRAAARSPPTPGWRRPARGS